MARPRSELRERAFQIYRDHEGKIKLKDLADQLGVPDNRIRKWKAEDKWEQKLKDPKGALPNEGKRSAPIHRGRFQPGNRCSVGHGAPKGNKNAVGNRGGAPPKGNKNAEKHGFFSRIFPDDEETRAIIDAIEVKSPLDILWENIVIQYTAIARAQKLMFVKDQDDTTKVLKRDRVSHGSQSVTVEKEWELQHAWDKHANFMQAQSRAIHTLERLIARYEEMLLQELETEERRAKVDKLRAEIVRLKGTEGDQIEDDGFLEALSESVKEVWADES